MSQQFTRNSVDPDQTAPRVFSVMHRENPHISLICKNKCTMGKMTEIVLTFQEFFIRPNFELRIKSLPIHEFEIKPTTFPVSIMLVIFKQPNCRSRINLHVMYDLNCI